MEVPPVDEKGKKGSAHKRQWRSPALLSAAHQPQLKNTPTHRPPIHRTSLRTDTPATNACGRAFGEGVRFAQHKDSSDPLSSPNVERRKIHQQPHGRCSFGEPAALAIVREWRFCGGCGGKDHLAAFVVPGGLPRACSHALGLLQTYCARGVVAVVGRDEWTWIVMSGICTYETVEFD